jgi:hypothetical protein
MKMKHWREYMGCIIWRKASPGSALKWTSSTAFRGHIAADTLEGIKAMIREDMKPKGKANGTF